MKLYSKNNSETFGPLFTMVPTNLLQEYLEKRKKSKQL